MRVYIAIAIGGVLGCWARYAMSNYVQGVTGNGFPFATLSVNVLACFVMGFLFVLMVERLALSPVLRAGALTGFLGGFSTFSTFAMEALLLGERGEFGKGLLYVAASVILGLAAAMGGAYIAGKV